MILSDVVYCVRCFNVSPSHARAVRMAHPTLELSLQTEAFTLLTEKQIKSGR